MSRCSGHRAQVRGVGCVQSSKRWAYCLRFNPIVTELHDGLGQTVRIERLLPPRDVCEADRDDFGAVPRGKDEGYALPLQLVGNAECVMPSQVDVDDPDVEAAAGELSACVVEIANERDHVCAERVKGGLQVAGEK